MTLAVLLPAEVSGPAGNFPPSLSEQLTEAGATEVRIDPGGDLSGQFQRIAALARSATAPLLLCGTDVLAHTAALRIVATEPGNGTVALVGPAHGANRERYAEVRHERGLIAEAGRPRDRAADSFLGVLRVSTADLPVLAECAERLATGQASAAGLAGTTGPGATGQAGATGRAGGPDGWRPAAALDLLLPALLGAGRRVSAYRIRLLVADRAGDTAEAASVRDRMAAVDEDRARLRLAVKERDDFFTTYFVSPVSPTVVRWAARAGLSPTQVTAVSVTLAVIAALGFAWGNRLGLVAGALLLYASFLLDCVDGQLARYSRWFSAFGGWLDTMADRSKEYVVYAGLAIGAERAGMHGVWPLALAAMVLQTVRHMTDTWYGALHDEAVARRPLTPPAPGSPREAGAPAAPVAPAPPVAGQVPGTPDASTAGPLPAGGSPAVTGWPAAGSLLDPGALSGAGLLPATGSPDGAELPAGSPGSGAAGSRPLGSGAAGGRGGGLGALLGRASERVQADTGSVAYWLKRIIVFPIGERWALIALTAALFNGRIALIAVLGWGGFAAAYTLGLRSLRARSMRVPVMTIVDTNRHRDDGPLARLLGRAAGAGQPTGVGQPAGVGQLAGVGQAAGEGRSAGAGQAVGGPGSGERMGAGRMGGGRVPPLPMAVLAALAAAGLAVAAGTGAVGSGSAAWMLVVGLAVVLCGGLPSRARHAGALDWLVPAALRAAEYLFVVAVAVARDVPLPLLFALLFALALHHYDLTARMEKRAAAAPARAGDLGWDGRVLILAVAAAAGVATAAVAVLAGYVVGMFTLGVIGAWAGTRAPHPQA